MRLHRTDVAGGRVAVAQSESSTSVSRWTGLSMPHLSPSSATRREVDAARAGSRVAGEPRSMSRATATTCGRDGEVVGGGLDLAARAGPHVAVGVDGRRDDAVHVAEPLEQRRGGLLADAGDAGQAVGGVAAQGREVGVLAGVDVVLRAHPVVGDPLVLADAAGDVEDAYVALVVDELEEVAVAGDDVDRLPRPGWRGCRSRRRPRSRRRRRRRARRPPARRG